MRSILLLAVLGASGVVAQQSNKEFLDTYVAQPDATALPSGLSYKVLKQGQGGKPGPSSSCKCNYEGRLSTNFPDGKTFDSSYQRGAPATFQPTQVIKCWTEAMQLMPVGSKWELVCPPEIAYGSRVMGSDIPANSVLVFTMELLECQGVPAIAGASTARRDGEAPVITPGGYKGTTNSLPSSSSMLAFLVFAGVVCFVFAGVRGKKAPPGQSRHGGG